MTPLKCAVVVVLGMAVVIGVVVVEGRALLEINKRNFPLQFYFIASDEAAPFM